MLGDLQLGKLYTLNIHLDADFSEKYIQKILDHGILLGFQYQDMLENRLTPTHAAQHITHLVPASGDIPHVYVNSDKIGSFFIGFYQDSNKNLELSIGGFGTPIKRDFSCSSYAIDWAYYISFLLPLVSDFSIVKLEIEAI
jgi:hypothetical protein